MKNFILSVVVVILSLLNFTAFGQGGWTLQTNPTTDSGRATKFVSVTEGWINLSSNALLHTTNGGTTWNVVLPNATDITVAFDATAETLSFINSSTGWVMKTLTNSNEDALGAVVYKTTNGGATWSRTVLSNKTNEVGIQLQFIDANNGWISMYNLVTEAITFKKTIDGGATWTATNGVGIFYYVNTTTGYSFTAGSNLPPPYTISKTTDGGANWTPQYVDNTAGDLSAIQFTDATHGWVVGDNGKIFKTVDGGATWDATVYNSNYGNNNIFFINNNEGWISTRDNSMGGTPLMLHTTNGGSTWSTQMIPFCEKVFSMYFLDASHGWATTSESSSIAKFTIPTGSYSNATLNGPWFFYKDVTPIDPYNDNLNYFVFDGNGNITDFNGFGGPWTSKYNVLPNGAFSVTITNGNECFSFGGQLTSTTEGTGIADGQNWRLHKVANPGALKDKIVGTLQPNLDPETNCGGIDGIRNVTLNIDNNGIITSAIGLIGPVVGRVYADLGVYVGHMTTGEPNTAGWHEFSIWGYYNNNNLTGTLGLESQTCSIGATSNLVRSDNQPISTDWTPQINPLGARMCGAMQFVSANEGWISIAPGGLLHTTDGGTTWTEKILHPTDVVGSPSDPGLNLSFISKTTGWVLKTFGTFDNPQGAVVYKTTDGGVNWSRKVVSTTTGDVGFQLQFVDANTGWILLYNSTTLTPTFLKTSDGGANWVPVNGAGIFSFVDANNGWAYSSPNQSPPYNIYKTTDGGTSWFPIAIDNTAGQINKMKFFDVNNGWIVGKNGKIIKTSDGGVNWTPITNAGINSEYKNKSVHFINPNVGWISSKRDNSDDNAIVLHTNNGGTSWTTQNTPSNYSIFSIYFWDANNGWYTGDYGAIARYTGTLNIKENIANKFISIYPNPSNGTFYFSLKESNSKLKAEIYTLSGHKVYEGSNFEMQPQNEINFAPQAKGIYIVKITDGKNSYSYKIIVQ